MPPCKATIKETGPCYAVLKTADGKHFSIGSPAAKEEVIQFLQTMKEGQTYHLPEHFLDFQKKRKE